MKFPHPRTILGEAQDPREGASQGFYCSGFINKTNKQTRENEQRMIIQQQTASIQASTKPISIHARTNKQTNKER